jgi:hypothetical protein
MEFHAFNFHPQGAVGITAVGYVSPTPIQVQAIPPVLEGRDVVGLALRYKASCGIRIERFVASPKIIPPMC